MCVIKICGLTRHEDALAAAQCGADYLGLVFHRPSKRCVSIEQALALTTAVNASDWGAKWMGVFVHEPTPLIQEIAEVVGLDGVQLHGQAHPDAMAELQTRNLLVFAGHRIAGQADIAQLDDVSADAHLLDAYVPGSPGGTGVTFDWSLAAQAALSHRILLAGGLTVDNVACAIEQVKPWGVDVSSGVETSPGIKDADRIQQFIEVARRAFDAQGGEDDD